MLSLPKRLRPALRADPVLATRVLRIFIESIERSLRGCCAAPADARPGAVSFLQRFGSALNEHWHYHCCVSDGVFHAPAEQVLAFVPAPVDAASVAAVQARVRRRVLAAYRRRGWLDAEAAANMAEWDHGGGFSVDASVAIHGNDRAGLERLLRYCARPCWAAERLTQASDGERGIYTLPKPALDGSGQITLTPLELLDRLARFIPAPRRHLHRYHGAFAPHSALRSRVAARAGQAIMAPPAVPDDLADAIGRGLCLFHPLPEPVTAAPLQARSWARLIARIYEVDPLRCRHCGGTMRLIAFIVEPTAIRRILDHLGEPSRTRRAAPIRGPPWADQHWDAMDDSDSATTTPNPAADVMPD